MRPVALIGTGFVADLYMRSFALHPEVTVAGVHDRDSERMRRFCSHWSVPGHATVTQLYASLPEGALILNLTNPGEHAAVTRSALEAGFHVFSEKPMTMAHDEAQSLLELAKSQSLHLASAPSSVLGEAAQTMGQALRHGSVGTPRLVYAELDDGYISQAPWQQWRSESGARWPGGDEFAVGCSLEHAGYYLSWLIAWFGAVRRVTSTTALAAGASGQAPDISVAAIEFHSGLIARLTCSIVASHDHQIRVFSDTGVLSLREAWDNTSAIRFHRRYTIRRRLVEHPIGKRIRLKGPTHPKVKRFGAAAMNFALGPVEMLQALELGRTPRLAGSYAGHLTEVTLATQRAGVHEMTSRCEPMEPMPWAR